MRLCIIICLAPALAAAGLPVITEVLPAPGGIPPFSEWWEGEYVELYNSGLLPLDPGEYRLRVGEITGPPLRSEPPGGLIPAGGYALLVPHSVLARAAAAYPGVLLLTDGRSRLGGYGLADAGLRLELVDSGGQCLSSATWTENPGRNTSLQRVDPAAADLPVNWLPDPWGGTPGRVNRSTPAPRPARRLQLEGRGCHPEKRIPLCIRLDLGDGEHARLELFSLEGKNLGLVAGVTGSGGGIRIPWYGETRGNASLLRGLYLLRLTITRSGSTIHQEARPVLLVRE